MIIAKEIKVRSSIVSVILLLGVIFLAVGMVSSRIRAAGAGVYQAEDAQLLKAIKEASNTGFEGEAYVNYDPNEPGGYIEWKVDAEIAGDYLLDFRYANGASDNRPAEISVNNKVVVKALDFNPTGDWTNWLNVQSGVKLKAGTNIIRLTATGPNGGANIDLVKVVYNFDRVFPAENADLKKAILEKKNEGYNGEAYVNYDPNEPGGYIEWTINVPAKDKYILEFRFANGSTADRPARIELNGEVIAEGLSFVPTGDWTNWTTTEDNVELDAGEYRVRATATGQSGGANIDSLRVYLASNKKYSNNKAIEIVSLRDLLSNLVIKKLTTEGLLVKDKQENSNTTADENGNTEIEKVQTIGDNIVMVTLDRQVNDFNIYNLKIISAPAGSYELKTDKGLKIKRAYVGENSQGNTVIVCDVMAVLERNEDNSVYVENRDNAVSASLVKPGSQVIKEGERVMAEDLTGELAKKPLKLTVAKSGSRNFSYVQDAIDSVPVNNIIPVEIFIKDGVYKEVITIPKNKPYISLIGESPEGTILTYDNYAGKERSDIGGTYGTTGSSSVFLHADSFTAKNLTFENSFDKSKYEGSGTQAVAVKSTGDKMYFENVRFLGQQDTLYANAGRQYFKDCYIEGDVDFIFGGARAVFESCEIRSLDRGSSSNNGYVTAASTSIKESFGYLFIDCKFTSDAAENSVHLGRPWHPGGDPDAIASVVVRDSYLGAHIKKDPWTSMSGFSAEDARFFEYNNSGPGAEINDMRPQLSDDEAEKYTIDNVLDGWKPVSGQK